MTDKIMDLRDHFRHLLDDESPVVAPDTTVPPAEVHTAVAPHLPPSNSLQKYMPFVFVLIVLIVSFVAYSNRQEFFDFCKPKTQQKEPTTPPKQPYEADESGDEDDDEEERVVDTTASVPKEEIHDPLFDPL